MFKNLWNLLAWFPHVEEEDAMLEDDVVVEDVLNAPFKGIASLCTTFPISLKLKLLSPNSLMKNTKNI